MEPPILYTRNEDFAYVADALTAGMVNMLVVNRHRIIPKPFGPVGAEGDRFELDLLSHLNPLGLTSTFVDDRVEYHVGQGEIHGGTNTLRRPREAPRRWAFDA